MSRKEWSDSLPLYIGGALQLKKSAVYVYTCDHGVMIKKRKKPCVVDEAVAFE